MAKPLPYANNEGVRIRYEVEGHGPPLVLLCGLTGYLEFWRDAGYVNSLKDDYQLVLIDLRGHGGSHRPHDPEAYKLGSLVFDIVAVLDDLSISKAHFLGYSLGGRIGFGLAKYAPTRFHSFIIGGANPYQSNPDEMRWWLQLLERGMSAVVAMYDEAAVTPETKVSPEMRARLLANDAKALTALLLAPEWQASLEDALLTMTVPCLIFVGEADSEFAGAKECVKHMQNAELVSFPGLGHEVYAYSHLVLPHITRFLEKVT